MHDVAMTWREFARAVRMAQKQSTVRKKMATGTFTYNALRAKIIKERIKTQRKVVSHLNSTKSKAVSVGTTAIKLYLSL